MGKRLVRYLGLHKGAPNPIVFEADGEVFVVPRGDVIEIDARAARVLLVEPGAINADSADWEPVAREGV